MNPKLKKVIAIIGAVAMGMFAVTLFIYLVWPHLWDGRFWILALLSFLVGLVMFLAIYLTKGFPAQQQKEDEARKLKEDYLKKLEESRRDKEENKENTDESTGEEKFNPSEAESTVGDENKEESKE